MAFREAMTKQDSPMKWPINVPTTQVIGHRCHGRSQSSGIGMAPNQSPIKAPLPPKLTQPSTPKWR